MKRLTVTLGLIFFLAAPAFAHEGHHHDGHQHDHAAMLCERYIPKADSEMPDFGRPNWIKVKEAQMGGVLYVFYHDAVRPEVAVAAMVASGTQPDTGLPFSRVSWQLGKEVRTARIEINEMVCVRSVYDKKGSKRDLEGLMKMVERASITPQ